MDKIYIYDFCPTCEKKAISELVHDKSDDSYYFVCDQGHDWENIKLLFELMRHLEIHSTSPTMGCWCNPTVEVGYISGC